MLVKSSFEDLLYVIAGLVWVAFSIYKGSQKQKKAKSGESNGVKKKSTIEELLGEFLNVKEGDVAYSQADNDVAADNTFIDEVPTEKKQFDTPQQKIFSYDDEFEEGNFSEESRVYTPETEGEGKAAVENNRKSYRIKKKPRFNVRRAIVYSEILNRPVY
jgi:hypothetical protein